MQCYADKKCKNEKTENISEKKRGKFSALGSEFGFSPSRITNFFSNVTVQPAVAPSFKSEAVVQCWKTKSLEEDTCPSSMVRTDLVGSGGDPENAVDYKITELRGLGLAAAQEEGIEDIDEYSTNSELAEFLGEKDKADMSYYSKLSALQGKRLAGTIHHMLSRDKLNNFYDMYCAETGSDNSEENEKRRQRRAAIMNNFAKEQDSAADSRSVLLSIRSNLVLGPDAAKRTDDPAHMKRGASKAQTDFDATGGDYSEISGIYQEIDAELSQPLEQRGDQDVFFERILNMMIEAQSQFEDIQRRKGLDPDRLNLDIEDLWVEDANHKFSKKPRSAN